MLDVRSKGLPLLLVFTFTPGFESGKSKLGTWKCNIAENDNILAIKALETQYFVNVKWNGG